MVVKGVSLKAAIKALEKMTTQKFNTEAGPCLCCVSDG